MKIKQLKIEINGNNQEVVASAFKDYYPLVYALYDKYKDHPPIKNVLHEYEGWNFWVDVTKLVVEIKVQNEKEVMDRVYGNKSNLALIK